MTYWKITEVDKKRFVEKCKGKIFDSDDELLAEFRVYCDFLNPRHTLARMANDLQFTPTDYFLNYCKERNLVSEKSYNKHFGTTQYKIDWAEVEKYWPKKQ